MPWLASCARVLQWGCGQPGVLGGFTPAGGAKSSCRGATAPQGLASSARSFIAPTMTPEPIWRAPSGSPRSAAPGGASRCALWPGSKRTRRPTSAPTWRTICCCESTPQPPMLACTAVCRLRARAARRSGAWGKGARSPSPRHPRAAWTALFPRATPASVDATVPTCKPAAVLILQVRAGLAQAEAAQSELPLGEEDEELAVDGLVDAGCSGVSQQRFIVDFFTHFHFAARPASAPAEHVQQLARAQQ